MVPIQRFRGRQIQPDSLHCSLRAGRTSAGQVYADAGWGGEITELDAVVALCIRRTPLVAQAEVYGELRSYFPVILDIEPRLFRFVGHCGIDIERSRLGRIRD